MPIRKVLNDGGLVKVWTNDVDDNSINQLISTSQLPFIHKHVAAMPDVHLGIGATIGSVIPTKGAIVPAAVGVDLGCGMMAVRTQLTANDLPDNLKGIRSHIEACVPHGGPGLKGSWVEKGYNMAESTLNSWRFGLASKWSGIISKHPKLAKGMTVEQLGTLGGGNHFIEVCLDEEDRVWIMLHSGSRGVGNRIGRFFIAQAKEEMEKYFIGEHLPNKDLAYLVEHTEIFNDYCHSVEWAQKFAKLNREIMMQLVVDVIIKQLKHVNHIDCNKMAINCHHNYIAQENHFNKNVWVTRKGAIRAREGDLGIIPGSMGARSFIVRGKGNKDSFCSCSHGAGRTMSRKEAKRRFTVEDLERQTQGIECPVDAERVDEIPSAYKDIDVVMNNQADLVDIVHTLRQVINVKG